MGSENMRPSLRERGRRGNAIIEVTLMAPWLFFLFVGVFDFGFYAYALISVQNAARVAVLNMAQTSSSWSSATATADACTAVSLELGSMANANTFPQDCGSLPLIVKTAALDGTTTPASADNTRAASVTVTYQTVPLIPIPGLLPSQYTFTRNVQMRVKGS
jgi:Flp pilus assembly protein TadG